MTLLHDTIDVLTLLPAYFYALAGLVGLVVGSFLNVVILRLPTMLVSDGATVSNAPDTPGDVPAIVDRRPGLVMPPSACPQCGHVIRPWHNIPVISYVLLRGRCAYCHASISWQYPAVEVACTALTMLAAWRFGVTFDGVMAAVMGWFLLALTVIDWRTMQLPDCLTLPLLWLGMLGAVAGWTLASPASAILGAAAGYMVLWLAYYGFRFVTGREGMGYGDFKLLAALGAWVGIANVAAVVLLAGIAGICFAVSGMLAGRMTRRSAMPFGPFLATAGFVFYLAQPLLAPLSLF